ncbi:hypothetical protein [Denitromonas iodatirespirans]|uniref:Uncharacterized protein n=1 Tax=Denitromonas iodatirespirans TaxID=2795389 RepID=A0A944DCS0_DENI1|nr:hypothetical protein [Denitromonas iodatirespirans]MBT0963072.1 hypothetical protein [Denitromonas iodatirespirans]
MKIDDPFGRSAQRQARNYASVCEALQAAGVDTPEQVERCLRSMTRNLLIGLAVIAALVLAVAVLAPNALPAALVGAAVLGLWMGAMAVNGRRHLQRYRRERFER